VAQRLIVIGGDAAGMSAASQARRRRDRGDLETVTYLLGRLHTHGTGAARQRSVFNRTGEMSQVIDYLAAQTRG